MNKMEMLVERLEMSDEFGKEYGYFPIFTGEEMGLLEAYLAERDPDGEGFWRSWSDGAAPKFTKEAAYQVYLQNGFFCFSRIHEDEEDAIIIKKVVEKIGSNKSIYGIHDFVEALKEVRENDIETDWAFHVVDTFTGANDMDGNYKELCMEFLGKEMEPYRGNDYEEGPYGGAFRDEDDLFYYKEGYHIY